METAAACEIARLPEDLLSAAISSTTPRDACRAAAVSPAFRAAADSDAVWSTFLPRDLPPLADGEISPAPPSKKGLFLRLSDSDRPLLLTDRLMSMWTDRETGAMCYMLSARALQIVWSSTPAYWRWIPLTGSRFSEGAELLDVCWLEIHGKIHSKMLSQNSTYAAYMVFKMADVFYGLDSPLQEALVSVGGRKSTRKVCLQQGKSTRTGYYQGYYEYDEDDNEDEDEDDNEDMDEDNNDEDDNQDMDENDNEDGENDNEDMDEDENEGEDVVLPQKRADGWLELEMGEFNSEEGEDGEVCISLWGIEGGHWKKGLIVQGIEIKPKKSG